MRTRAAIFATVLAAASAAAAAAQTVPVSPTATASPVAAPAAVANPALISELADSLFCNHPRLGELLAERVEANAAASADIGLALSTLANDAQVCAPLRIAAGDVLLTLEETPPAQPSQPQPQPVVASAIPEAFAEAERRAASLEFEAGPPPINLTRTRSSRP